MKPSRRKTSRQPRWPRPRRAWERTGTRARATPPRPRNARTSRRSTARRSTPRRRPRTPRAVAPRAWSGATRTRPGSSRCRATRRAARARNHASRGTKRQTSPCFVRRVGAGVFQTIVVLVEIFGGRAGSRAGAGGRGRAPRAPRGLRREAPSRRDRARAAPRPRVRRGRHARARRGKSRSTSPARGSRPFDVAGADEGPLDAAGARTRLAPQAPGRAAAPRAPLPRVQGGRLGRQGARRFSERVIGSGPSPTFRRGVQEPRPPRAKKRRLEGASVPRERRNGISKAPRFARTTQRHLEGSPRRSC